MDFKNTKITLERPLASYEKVKAFIGWLLRGKRPFIKKSKSRATRYLDIGCGKNTSPDFINLDYNWAPGVDIVWDITKGIPIEDGSLDGIFSEHCFEHISLRDLDFVLAECFRILAPQGTIRIVMPDAELYLRGYAKETTISNERHLPYAEHDAYNGMYSPIMSVNRIFRDHGHLFLYDFDCLKKLLQHNGFSNIAKREFSCGTNRLLCSKDTKAREIESLYVEASKELSRAANAND